MNDEVPSTSRAAFRPPDSLSLYIPHDEAKRMLWLHDSARLNGIHIMGGPGSGKSRWMGRGLAWLNFWRGQPQIVLDPTGGTIDNFLDVIRYLPREIQEQCWPRIRYVDMGAEDVVVPFPLYYRLHEEESLYTTSQRFPEVVRRMDPYLQTAAIQGWNALYKLATYLGMILAVLGWQITEAEQLIRYPERWEQRLRRAAVEYPEVRPAVEFFLTFKEMGANERERLASSLTTKILPFTADRGMAAMFGASTPGIDWAEAVATGETVLLDFRHELNQERRRFKLLWVFITLMEFFKVRGIAGREQPVSLLIDEITQLLGVRAMEHSVMAEDIEELVSVIARNYGVQLCIAHQSLSQLDDRIRNVLMQMGTQFIGVTPNPDDARYLARQFYRYDPYWVKKIEPIWMNVPLGDPRSFVEGRLGLESVPGPVVIDETTVEFTSDEQELMGADRFRNLDPLRFLVRLPQKEGDIHGVVSGMRIDKIDPGRYPDQELLADLRMHLHRHSGTPAAAILEEIDKRLVERPVQVKAVEYPAILNEPYHAEDDPDPLPATADAASLFDEFWEEVPKHGAAPDGP